MKSDIQNLVKKSIQVKERLLADDDLLETLVSTVELITAAFEAKGKVLFCGNGGSAADAQHIAAELSGRFYKDRAPLFAEALHVNSSYVSAVANDYGYELVYSRLVQAMGREGDVLVAISTSGNSSNILRAAERAKMQKMTVIGLTGESGGQLKELSDHCICVPSSDTPRIQESHILIGHILCELVEAKLF